MSHLDSMPRGTKVYDVFAMRPETFGPFTDFCENVMRGPSSLSPGERELIGAFVSALNDCPYCHDIHNSAAMAHGLDGAIAKSVRDGDGVANVSAKMRALLAYVRKLTETPYRMTRADARAVNEAGWNDDALLDAIAVASLFSFMNRFVFALGIEADDAYSKASGARIREQGYAASLATTRRGRDSAAPD